MTDKRGIMQSAIMATAGFFAVLAISACTPEVEHRVTAPQLDTAIHAIQATACPPLPPLQSDVVIDIKGDKVTANAGGEQLLRDYVSARDCLRGAH